VLIEFDATSGLTEQVTWVAGRGNVFEFDLFFLRPLQYNKFFHVDMAGAFGGLLGIVKLSSPAVVNCDLGGKHLFKLELLQDRADVECGFSCIYHKTEFGLSNE
jgi:hypothetical protein